MLLFYYSYTNLSLVLTPWVNNKRLAAKCNLEIKILKRQFFGGEHKRITEHKKYIIYARFYDCHFQTQCPFVDKKETIDQSHE